MLSLEFEWLNQNREECFKYRGEYIAVIGTEIVAHGKDLREVVAVAKKFGKIPYISKIPSIGNEPEPSFNK